MTEPLTLTAALLAGLLGAGHCLAMCGGIAGALSGARPERPLLRTTVLSSGRVTGYALAGTLAGSLGAAVSLLFTGPFLRVGFGLVLALIGLKLVTGWRGPVWLERLGLGVWRRFAPGAGALARSESVFAGFGLGLLWGWLPCGLVYAMLGAAALSGGALQGATLMMAFGLGTLPAVAGAGWLAGHGAGFLTGVAFRRFGGCAMIAFGLWTAAVPLQHLAH